MIEYIVSTSVLMLALSYIAYIGGSQIDKAIKQYREGGENNNGKINKHRQ